MPLKLHITNKRYSSWSMRPWVLLKALDIPFQESIFYLKPGTRQPDFLTFSPTGKVPCLYDLPDDGEQITDKDLAIWDSLAITEYLAEKYPSIWPLDPKARSWARCAASEMHSSFPAIRSECSMNVALRIQLPTPLSNALQRDIARFTELFKQGIENFGGPWLAGKEFTAVDAFFAPIASRCKTYGIVLEGVAGEYVDRLFEHFAVQEWIRDGIRETEREPVHEQECIAGRKVLVDFCKQE